MEQCWTFGFCISGLNLAEIAAIKALFKAGEMKLCILCLLLRSPNPRS